MAYADPQSITIAPAAAVSLPRTASGTDSGSFRTPDGTAILHVGHAYGRRQRRTVRLEHSKIAADPLTAVNQRVSMTAYVVVDVPPVGYTVAEAQAVIAGLTKWLTDSSAANVAKLLGGEN